jgi:hypothetical protein
MRKALAQQILGVAGLRDHVDPGFGEQPHDPLAQEDVIFADHHANRI